MNNTIAILIVTNIVSAMFFCVATNKIHNDKELISEFKYRIERQQIKLLTKTEELISCEENK